jgi:hypothetical protein
MSEADPQGFVDRFTRVWASPQPDSFAGDHLFIEWTITMTPPGEDEPITWEGVDRFTLKGDRAVEGIAYFDTSPMWTRIGASPDEGDLLDAAARRRQRQRAPA